MDLALNKKFFNACVNGEIAKVLGMIDLDGVDLNLVDAEQNKTSLDAIVLSKLDVDKKITIINLLLAKGAIASSSFKRFAVESDSIPLLASLHGNGQLSVDDLMEMLKPLGISASEGLQRSRQGEEMGHIVRIIVPKYGAIDERKFKIHEVVRLKDLKVNIGDKEVIFSLRSSFLIGPKTRVQIYFLDTEKTQPAIVIYKIK